MSWDADSVHALLAGARLCIDKFEAGRTSFLSHYGASPSLKPGAWIAHRDLLRALALANLSRDQRGSLAKALLVDYEREFGVGRLRLSALPSGLPLGGSHLWLQARGGEGPRVLYSWSFGPGGKAAACDWLLLRADPSWAVDPPPRPLTTRGLETLVQLGGRSLIAVRDAVDAARVYGALEGLEVGAHPRFRPHLEGAALDGPLLLWPHDALDAQGLRKREVHTLVLVGAPERVRQAGESWARSRGKVEVVEAACPRGADFDDLLAFWREAEEPKVLLRGDPSWCRSGRERLEDSGATVAGQGEATQLGLFGGG